MNTSLSRFFRQFVRIITFIDLPINRKFKLFSIGVLFWLLALAAVATLALISIDTKYGRIVHKTIPHERVAQKIIRNLRSIALEAEGIGAAGDKTEIVRHYQLAVAYLEDIRSFNSALALGGKVTDFHHDDDTERVAESFETSSVADDSQGVAYLRELSAVTEEIDKALQAFVEARVAQLAQPPGTQPAQFKDNGGRFRQLLSRAIAISSTFSAQTNQQYRAYVDEIGATIRHAVIAMIGVLLVALVLLGIFTHWISDAIARPIRAVIRQIHSLAIGEVDLSQKIEITSQDEIGTLSAEFNHLMETVYGMTNFKNVIEEDSQLSDIYARLGEVFAKVAGIDDYCIYEIKDNRHEMQAVYPPGTTDAELRCKPEILGNCELCRARKTGHEISSFVFPGVCLQFKPDCAEQQHVCLPVNVGGRIGGVVQFLFRPTRAEKLDPQEIQLRTYKAEAYLKQSQSVLEAKRHLHTLRESALKDALTGLYNRRFLQEHSQQIIAGAKRRQKDIGLLMCDLDYFKQVNDKYGHETGDLLLRETSSLIAKSVRESDYVIRFGGEEFLVLLLDVDNESALKVAEKVRAAVSTARIRTSDGTLSKTISIGVSVFPADTDAFWQAIKYADVALYKAKETGRNKVVRFTAEMWAGEAF